jgi:uncharacterized protein (TIGR02217 family)
MSNAVFPKLKGITWDITIAPTWSTVLQVSASGREVRAANQQYPLWSIGLTYEVLPDTPPPADAAAYSNFKTLLGFYNARQGNLDDFLLNIPDLLGGDSSAEGQSIVDEYSQGHMELLGLGDGVTTDFPLVKDFGGFMDLIQNPTGVSKVWVNGADIGAAYTLLNATPNFGVIRLNAAPAAAQEVRADFGFQWRCRFDDDALEFNNWQRRLWEAKTVKLKTVRL